MAGSATGGLKYALMARENEFVADATAPGVTDDLKPIAMQWVSRCYQEKGYFIENKLEFNFRVDQEMYKFIVIADEG